MNENEEVCVRTGRLCVLVPSTASAITIFNTLYDERSFDHFLEKKDKGLVCFIGEHSI